jgi:hypothetical protein
VLCSILEAAAMVVLEVVLALAVTMLAFSTVVSMIVEILHRILRLRVRGLQDMLRALYEDVLHQRFLGASADGGASAAFAATMTGMKGSRSFAARWRLPDWLRGLLDRESGELNVLEFSERLARTDVGKAIARHAEAEINTLIDDLALQFERFGQDATTYFRRRAQLIAVAVSLLLAFAMNVNVVTLTEAFISDQALTSGMLAKTEAFLEASRAQQERLQETLAAGAAEPQTLQDVQASYERLDANLAELGALALPIGFDRYPYCVSEEEGAKPCEFSLALSGLNSGLEALLWFLATLATGFLIGLGGPFWYDIVRRLSLGARVARDLLGSGKAAPGKGKPIAGGGAEAPQVDGLPDTPSKVFKLAIDAERIGSKRPRNPVVLLQPDGTLAK